MMALNKIWKTSSGYEALIRESSIGGQYIAYTRKVDEIAWIEIGRHYGSRTNAYDACELLAEKYNENPPTL